MMYSQDNDRFLGLDPKTSTRFDRNFSISDFIRINVGTEIGLPLVSGAREGKFWFIFQRSMERILDTRFTQRS